MTPYVLGFEAIDRARYTLVGGKGAALAELSRIEGIRVPQGFCVTTEAYRRTVGQCDEHHDLLERLSHLRMHDRNAVREISADIRRLIAGADVDEAIGQDIFHQLSLLGEGQAHAVRSSATSEDLPTASFAGQQDTYLNIRGRDAILQHIRKCWASLFAERAVIYRIQNGFSHRAVLMAVVVQRMVFPRVAGTMFTADPVTSNRRVLSIDASLGLGEALVSGLVNPDVYKVREGRIVFRQISSKRVAVCASEDGGTERREVEPARQNRPALSREQILRLEGLGRKIEAHFGSPQDIEWCVNADGSPDGPFHILQSRPITTLFPLPEKDGPRVYVSVGHQQMMTDAMKPLGLSVFGLLYQGRPFYKAGGRLFLDLTDRFASPDGRRAVLEAIGASDPLTKAALVSLTRRKTFMQSLKPAQGEAGQGVAKGGRRPPAVVRFQPEVIPDLIARSEASVHALRQRIASVSGDDLFDAILQDQAELRTILFDPRSIAVIMAGTHATRWLNRNMERWLGEKGIADALSQSVANNVTSEMGLALLDVADVVRQHPEVIGYFQHPDADTFFADLAGLAGGDAVTGSLRAYLDPYGMRCAGEIDITRARWTEEPTALVPVLLNHVQNSEPNSRATRFEAGRMEAERRERDILGRLAELSNGKRRAAAAARMIRTLRSSIAYREYPKYAYIQRFWIYKQGLLREAASLLQHGVIRARDDVYYLTFEEFREAVRTRHVDHRLVASRQAEHEAHDRLMPPRVMTSEGEVIRAEVSKRDIPRDALPGIAASAGVVEGRARVVFRMQDAAIEDGDILVTRFTDPSWTPLFVSVRGLVTEVGGVMTHGAVIAREYGLPAVVSVDSATTLIRDGQRIRVNGTQGYVEPL